MLHPGAPQSCQIGAPFHADPCTPNPSAYGAGTCSRRRRWLQSGQNSGRRCCTRCRACWGAASAAAKMAATRTHRVEQQLQMMLLPPRQQSAPCRSCWYAVQIPTVLIIHERPLSGEWQAESAYQTHWSRCGNALPQSECCVSCKTLRPAASTRLQAEEQPTETSGQRSKTASKRACKKAARQGAGAASQDHQTADAEDGATAAPASTTAPQVVNTARSSPPAADALQPAAVPQMVAVAPDSMGNEVPSASSSAAAPSAADWCRCALSGRVMRDPVLIGSGGHSFEREALEEWLAANPGVDPLSRQPLPPGSGGVLANHALRNLIQQLQPAWQ